MNRKQRRAASKQAPASGLRGAPVDPIKQLFADAALCQRRNDLAEAARRYKRLLQLKPDHAEACNNLGCVLLAQGKLREASTRLAQALALLPQLFEQFSNVLPTLTAVLPAIDAAMHKATAVWPTRLTAEQLLGESGFAAIAGDPLLLCILRSVPVRDIALERLLTALRLALLDIATSGGEASEETLAFCCAVAGQCFINEYVFVTTPAEEAQVERLKAAIASGATGAPLALAAIAMYLPLHTLPDAVSLLERRWPAPLDDVLTQQLREPLQEHALRASIPRLTPIDDDVSQRVRQQYEENPYPRWINPNGGIEPTTIERYLRDMSPTAAFEPLVKDGPLDILVAGCGTGLHSIGIAQRHPDAQVLAVDLSLTSLCYAKRKTPPALARNITYMQGDILKLGGIGRSFDVIDAGGVLHHMADPLAAWRILLGLLRPGGFMHLGLYSELARRDIVAARAAIAERGYAPTPSDIRRCRQELLETPLRSLARSHDFFSTSECRDLLFHVQESRMTIPGIKAFLAEHGLKFIGFEFSRPLWQDYRDLFARNGWSLSDLDRWHAVETAHPDTFAAMYQFWLQKP
jgi:SAM-dependent methyltransferase